MSHNSLTAQQHFPRNPAATRARKSRRFDIGAGWLLTTYLLCLMIIPANLTIPALGSAGAPALLIGIVCLIYWLGTLLSRVATVLPAPHGIRRAMIAFTIVVLVSYVIATVRPIEGVELTSADRGLLLIASWLGVVLLASDGLIGVGRVEALLRRLVICGGIVATVGIAQFLTGLPLVDTIQIPGLSPNNVVTSFFDRGGFTRTSGTSTHPIEFGVLLAMLLPVALHFALVDKNRNALLRWFPVVAMAMAVPTTISRSSIIAVIVALLIVVPTWSAHQRRAAYGVIAVGVVAIYVAIPGMLGTLTQLFTGISADGSARSRTDGYALAFDFIEKSPFFGRGFSTFLPQYRILDNQYLGLLIEVGIVGVLVLLTLFITAFGSAIRVRQMAASADTRSLAQGLIAMVAAGVLSFATFDAFGFPQVASLVFLGIGGIGALLNSQWRQSHLQDFTAPPDQGSGQPLQSDRLS